MNQPAKAATGRIRIKRTAERACRRPIYEAIQGGRRIAKLTYLDKAAMNAAGLTLGDSPHWAVLWDNGPIDRHDTFSEASDNALKGY